MLIQKQAAQGEQHISVSKEEYKMQYHVRTRILIIDDEPDITFGFKKALRDKGFEQVETANDSILALKNFKAGSFDLLIIDLVMPEMDGFSLYEEIRKIDNKVKVCFITAFEINYQALRAVFPGPNTTDDIGCFIRKPVDMDDLVKQIRVNILIIVILFGIGIISCFVGLFFTTEPFKQFGNVGIWGSLIGAICGI